jgi:hypothetical protein
MADRRDLPCVDAIGEVASRIEIVAGLTIIATALFGSEAFSERAFRLRSSAQRRRPYATGSSVTSHCASGRPSIRHWCWPAGI